jgi:hypothetical protein
LDGVIATLLEDGYCKEKIYGCHNRTVVVNARRGELANKHKQVLAHKCRLRNVPLYEKGEEWIHSEPLGLLATVLPGTRMDLEMIPLTDSVWLVSRFAVDMRLAVLWRKS